MNERGHVRAREYPKVIWLLVLIAGMVCVRASDLADRLTVIRSAFEDGIDDLVRREATAFLKTYGNRPESGEVRMILGIVLDRSGRLDAAAKQFEVLARGKDPALSAQAAFRLGRIHWRKKRFSEAAAAFQTAWEKAPSGLKEDAGYWRAMSLYRAGAYAAAATAIEEFMPVCPETRRAVCRFMQGNALLQLEQTSRAAEVLVPLIEAGDPKYGFESALRLAEAASKRGEYDSADRWAAAALSFKPSCAAYRIRAAAAAGRNRWGCAADCLELADRAGDCADDLGDLQWAFRQALYRSRAARSGGGPETWLSLLIFLCRHPDQAEFRGAVLSEWVLSTDPSPPPELTALLIDGFDWDPEKDADRIIAALAQADQPDAALNRLARKHLDDGDAVPPPEELLLAADLLRRTGDTAAAVRILDALPDVTGDPANTGGLKLAQADLFFSTGEYARAAALYQQCLVNVEDVAERRTGLFRLGESYFRAGDHRLAEPVFKTFLEKADVSDPRREAALRRLLVIASGDRKWPAVIELADRLLKEYPGSDREGEILFQKGIALANTGDDDGAVDALSRALDRVSRPEYVDSIKACIRQVTAHRAAKRRHEAGPADAESDGRKETIRAATPTP